MMTAYGSSLYTINSEDIDEMSEDLQYLLTQIQSSGNKVHLNLEFLTYDALICIMNQSLVH